RTQLRRSELAVLNLANRVTPRRLLCTRSPTLTIAGYDFAGDPKAKIGFVTRPHYTDELASGILVFENDLLGLHWSKGFGEFVFGGREQATTATTVRMQAETRRYPHAFPVREQ